MSTGTKTRCHFDAFVSHSSKDSAFAAEVARLLGAAELTGWIDSAEMRFGHLLRNEIQGAIRDARVLVLLWSKHASQSRWVMSEMFTAFHLDRFIIPCVLDSTPLPQFLDTAAYLDQHRDRAELGPRLTRAIEAAPRHANQVTPLLAGGLSPTVQAVANGVAAGQYAVLEAVKTDLRRAAKANASIDDALSSLKKLAPLRPEVLNLSGYQCKNNYMIKHWDATQAGQAPKDPLLDQAERCFFETLCLSPSDPSAINGLGTVLFYQRDLDAAEFFVRRAMKLLEGSGQQYEAAQHDLDMILSFKNAAKTQEH